MRNTREISRSSKQLRAANDGVFKRRKKGIKKKAMELATLCDVVVCVMIQAPSGEYEMWPENPHEVRAIVSMLEEESNELKNSSRVLKSSRDSTNTGLPSADFSSPRESFYGNTEVLTQRDVPNIEIGFPWNQLPDFCLPTESFCRHDELFTQEEVPNMETPFLCNQFPDFSLSTENFYGNDKVFTHGEVPHVEIGFQRNEIAEFVGQNWSHENSSEMIDFLFEGKEPAEFPGENWFHITRTTNCGSLDANQQYSRGNETVEEPAAENWWAQMLAIDDLQPPTFFHS